MSKQSDVFFVGDEIIYNAVGSKVEKNTKGVVVGTRDGVYPIGVKFFDYTGMFYDLDGLDDTRSSLWCRPESLILAAPADSGFSMQPDALEDFLA